MEISARPILGRAMLFLEKNENFGKFSFFCLTKSFFFNFLHALSSTISYVHSSRPAPRTSHGTVTLSHTNKSYYLISIISFRDDLTDTIY